MRRFILGGAIAAALAGFVALFLHLGRPPAGPVEPAWDRTACAHCRMHLGEPAFAAQLQLEGGEVLFFDDPGCLFAWRADASRPDRGAAGGRAYFHRHDGAGWLAESETGFAAVVPTPMGWGLAAVEAATPGAISAAEAERGVRERLRSGTQPSQPSLPSQPSQPSQPAQPAPPASKRGEAP